MTAERKLRLLLLGSEGTGKSAFGNFLLDQPDAFKHAPGFVTPVERAAVKREGELLPGVKACVIDTPGIPSWLEDVSKDEAWLQEVKEVVTRATAGEDEGAIDGVLYVVSAGSRFLEREQQLLECLEGAESEFWSFFILVFTKAIEVGESEEKQREFISKEASSDRCPSAFKWLLDKASERFVVLEAVNFTQEYRRRKVEEIHQLLEGGNSCKHYSLAPFVQGFKSYMDNCKGVSNSGQMEQRDSDNQSEDGEGPGERASRICRCVCRWSGCCCFPEDASITTSDNKVKVMRDLCIGDRVLCLSKRGKPLFSEVIAFLHYEPDRHAEYLVIETYQGITFSVSPEHLIFTAKSKMSSSLKIQTKFAGCVKQSDCVLSLSDELGHPILLQVKSVCNVRKRGIYAPLTRCGSILVDDVLMSCYAKFYSHTIAHMAFAPFRIFKSVTKASKSDRPKDGIHAYASLLHKVTESVFPQSFSSFEQHYC